MRKKSNQKSFLPIVLLVYFVLIIGLVYWGYTYFTNPYRAVAAFDAEQYLSDANGLRGNTYQFNGEVDQVLSWDPNAGRVLAVTAHSGEAVPVLVPVLFNELTIQNRQLYHFKVFVEDKGILRVVEMKKQ